MTPGQTVGRWSSTRSPQSGEWLGALVAAAPHRPLNSMLVGMHLMLLQTTSIKSRRDTAASICTLALMTFARLRLHSRLPH